MNKQDFEDAFIAKLSGIAKYKNENEIILNSGIGQNTIEFLNDSPSLIKIRYYDPSGFKIQETDYKNGKLHGKKIVWHSNGLRNREIHYKHDEVHGKFIEWYPNGMKATEGNYKNGLHHGKYAGWFKSGIKQWEANYKNGQQHGKYTDWYEDGNIKWQVDYKNGKLQGKRIKWGLDKIKTVEETYLLGQLVSQHNTYHNYIEEKQK
jgi:antitoxin component YwqK of YwqJK toxin-antitoxin module